MRSYGITKGRFWNGPTGREIRGAGADVQLVALYLFTSPHANAIGLYYLPFELLQKHLALPGNRIRKALLDLDRLHFAHYDDITEVVWVHEMAHHQLGAMKESDGRVKAVSRIYAELPPNPYLGKFFDRYAAELHLSVTRRDVVTERVPPGVPQGPPYTVPDPSPNPSPVLLGRSGNPFSPEQLQAAGGAPLDVLFNRLLSAYPSQRVSRGYLTQAAFVDVVTKDGRPTDVVFEDLMAHLQNQRDGYEWRVKRMIPKLEKWLREGLCWQLHDEQPPTAIVSEKSLQNMASADAFVKGGTNGPH